MRAGSNGRPGSEREAAQIPLERIAARLLAYSDSSGSAALRRTPPSRPKARQGGGGRPDIFEPRATAADGQGTSKPGPQRPEPAAAEPVAGSPAAPTGRDDLVTKQDLRALHDAVDRAGQAMARQTRREVEEAMAAPVRALRDEVRGLAKTMGRSPGPRAVLSIERRLDEIRTCIDALVRDGGAQTAEALRIDGRLDQIDARLSGLAHAVDGLAPAAGADTLAALRAEIVRLTTRLEAHEVKGTDLSPVLSAVEKDLGEMRAHMDMVRDLAARGGSGASPAGAAPPAEQAGDIRRSLAEIRAAQSHGSRQSEQGFEAMRRSLAELTQRLRTMEQPGARPGPGSEPRGPRADARVLVGAGATPSVSPTPRVAPPRPAAARSSSITAPAAQVTPAPVAAPQQLPTVDGSATEPPAASDPLDQPLRPDETPPARVPAGPAMAGGLVAAPATIKASFINAARRARGLIGEPAPAGGAEPAAPATAPVAAPELSAEPERPAPAEAWRGSGVPLVETPPSQAPAVEAHPSPSAVRPPSPADAALARNAKPGVKPRSPIKRGRRPWLGRRGLFWASGLAIAAVSAPAAVSIVQQLPTGQPKAPSPGQPAAQASKAPAPVAPAPVGDAPPSKAPAAPAQVPASPSTTLSESPNAIYDVGDRLVEGGGGAKDLKLAATILEKAAERGLAPAQYRLGRLYEKGLGLPRDAARARFWYQRAAVQGNVKAMHNLAVLCADGGEGKPDYAVAAMWFRRAAELGLSDSQFNLAVLLTRGLGVRADAAEAYTWFAIAARRGDAEAARRRDEVGAVLSALALGTAQAAADRWQARPLDRAANEAAPGTDTPTPAPTPPAPPAPPSASSPAPVRSDRA